MLNAGDEESLHFTSRTMSDASSAVLVTVALPLIGMAAQHRVRPVRSASSPKGWRGRLLHQAKQGADFGASLLLLIGLTPLFLVIALAIWTEDRQNPLYRRRVLHRQNVNESDSLRTFAAFKFRTMVSDADSVLQNDAALQSVFRERHKLYPDPRETRVGRFLRTTGLDELPQILNVLRGEMSLVGPRMITPEELARYGADSVTLLSVRPGITGWWQVNGWHQTSYDERVTLDIWYIENWSLWLDFCICCRTPFGIWREWRSLRTYHNDN